MTAATSLDQSLLYPSPLKEFWQAFSHNKGAVAGLAFMLLMVFCALFAPWVAPHAPSEQYRDFLLTPPVWLDGGQWRFLLGTDDQGRDVLSAVLYGLRLSLIVGMLGVLVSGTLGPDVFDIRKLYGDLGVFTFDPGYVSTGSTESKITYIDGDAGILLGDHDPVGRFEAPALKRMGDKVPHLERHDLPGAGHWLQAECGARVSALLLDFLARNYR